MNTLSSRPLIGVNLENKPEFIHRQNNRVCGRVPEICYISSDYTNAIFQAGAIPVLLPPVDKLDLISGVLDHLDGLLFVGGPDLDPRNDHCMLHASVRPMTHRREKFDRALMKEAANRRIPVMGVGVGMQLLNVTQKGTLLFHIPEDLPSAFIHALPSNTPLDDAPLRHRIIVEKGTLLYSVYGDNAVCVNSRHHMAVDAVAEGFSATALCPGTPDFKPSFGQEQCCGDVVEAIESNLDDWFAFGVQFHPEDGSSATDLDHKLFHEFVKGVVYYKETGRNILTMKPRTKESAKRLRKSKNSEVPAEQGKSSERDLSV